MSGPLADALELSVTIAALAVPSVLEKLLFSPTVTFGKTWRSPVMALAPCRPAQRRNNDALIDAH